MENWMSSNAGATDTPLESTVRHQRESFWQITFPVIITALIFIGLVVAMVLLTRPESGKAISIVADYAMIVVILPMCTIGLITAAAIAGMIYGVNWTLKKVPPYTNMAQKGAKVGYRTVVKVTDTISSVSIGALAVLGGFANALQKWGLIPESEPEAEAEELKIN
jgi:hypothetical protein